MTLFRRLRGERLLAAALLLACAPVATAAEITLRISADDGLPRTILVASEGVDGLLGAVRLDADPDAGGAKQGRYRGELGPGRWRLVGFAGSVLDVELAALVPAVAPSSDVDVAGSALVSLLDGGAEFEVAAGDEALDLGWVAVLGRGNVGVIDRRTGDAGWRVPVAAFAADPRLQALRADVRWLRAPGIDAGGRWWVLASGGRVAMGAPAAWTVHRVMEAGVATRLVTLDAAGVVVIGEFDELEWLAPDGARQPLVSPVEAREFLRGLACDDALRCVAVVAPETDRGPAVDIAYGLGPSRPGRLLLSTDARQGGWREVGVVEYRDRVGMVRAGEDVLVVGQGDALHRIPLDGTRAPGVSTLPRRAAGRLVTRADGWLGSASMRSSDGGLTWHTVPATMADPDLPMDDTGQMYDFQAYTLRVGRQDGSGFFVDQRPVYASAWRAIGGHVVAPQGPLQAIALQDELLVSPDRGQQWIRDDALVQALRAASAPDGALASRPPAAVPAQPAPAGPRMAVLLDPRFDQVYTAGDPRWAARVYQRWMAPLNVPWLPPQLPPPLDPQRDVAIAGVVDAALASGLGAHGWRLAGPVRHGRPGTQQLARMRFDAPVDGRMMLRAPPPPALSLAAAPIVLSHDARRLRIALDAVVRPEGTGRFERLDERHVVVVVDAPETSSAAAAADAWASGEGRALREAIYEATAWAVAEAAWPTPDEAQADVGPIDLWTSLGVERVDGVVLAVRGRHVVVQLATGERLRIEGRLLADVIAKAAQPAGGSNSTP